MYLQFHSVKEPSQNHGIWVPVLFSSLLDRVRFGLGSCTFLHSGLGSVRGKTCVLVRFGSFLLAYGSFP